MLPSFLRLKPYTERERERTLQIKVPIKYSLLLFFSPPLLFSSSLVASYLLSVFIQWSTIPYKRRSIFLHRYPQLKVSGVVRYIAICILSCLRVCLVNVSMFSFYFYFLYLANNTIYQFQLTIAFTRILNLLITQLVLLGNYSRS